MKRRLPFLFAKLGDASHLSNSDAMFRNGALWFGGRRGLNDGFR